MDILYIAESITCHCDMVCSTKKYSDADYVYCTDMYTNTSYKFSFSYKEHKVIVNMFINNVPKRAVVYNLGDDKKIMLGLIGWLRSL